MSTTTTIDLITQTPEYQQGYHDGARAVYRGMTSLSGVVPMLAQIRNQSLECLEKVDELLSILNRLGEP